MLSLSLKQLILDKGIDNPYRLLVNQGFTHYAATKLIKGGLAEMSFAQLEKLCLAFRCTPDDLFRWQPPQGVSTGDQPLQRLIAKDIKGSIGQQLKVLPAHKLEQLRAFMDQLNKDE